MAAALTSKSSTMLAMTLLLPLLLSAPASGLPQGLPPRAGSLDRSKLTDSLVINIMLPSGDPVSYPQAQPQVTGGAVQSQLPAESAVEAPSKSREEGVEASLEASLEASNPTIMPTGAQMGGEAGVVPVESVAPPSTMMTTREPEQPPAQSPAAPIGGKPSIAMGVGMIVPAPSPSAEKQQQMSSQWESMAAAPKETAAQMPEQPYENKSQIEAAPPMESYIYTTGALETAKEVLPPMETPTEMASMEMGNPQMGVSSAPEGTGNPQELPQETLTVTKTVTAQAPAMAAQNAIETPATGAIGGSGNQGAQNQQANSVEPCAVLSSMQADFFRTNGKKIMTAPIASATACLNSVPLSKEVARAQINGVLKYAQFQSTLAFLKNPPKENSNQQPQGSVDPFADMQQLADDIDSGKVTGEYEFETRMNQIFSQANDGHFQMIMPMLASIGYQTPFDMLPFSTDGRSMPKIFRVSVENKQLAVDNQAVTKMDGEDVVDALTKMASLTIFQSPDARFNALFPGHGFANDISMDSSLRNMNRFPGNDTFSLTFENGTTSEFEYQALIASDLTGISSGQDFFDKLVFPQQQQGAGQQGGGNGNSNPVQQQQQQQQQPQQQQPSQIQPGQTAGNLVGRTGEARLTFDAAQKQMKTEEVQWKPMTGTKAWTPQRGAIPVLRDQGGTFAGFFLNNSQSTAVMRVNSFTPPSEQALANTIDTMAAFLGECRKQNKTNLVIDLQNNGGGAVVLGLDMYAQLFPENQTPRFSAQRQRANTAGKIYGQAFAAINEQVLLQNEQNQALAFAAFSPWALAGALQSNNSKPFLSFDAWVGPQVVNGDNFTNDWRFNDAGEIGLQLDAQLDPSLARNLTNPFKAENIVLLTDGRCSSTCSTFSEFMQQNAGVRTVAVGGIPQDKPMAHVGGVRGAEVQPFDSLELMTQALNLISQPQSQEEAQLRADILPGPLPIKTQGSVNFLDNMREGSTTPLQFIEDPADCRMFFTLDSFQDLSVLWTSVANSAFDGMEDACARGSLQGKQSQLGQGEQVQQVQQEQGKSNNNQSVGNQGQVQEESNNGGSQINVPEGNNSPQEQSRTATQEQNTSIEPITLCGGVPCQ